MSTTSPRPEAQPRTYHELSKTQQRAVVRIVQFLDQFVAQPQRARDDHPSVARLDLNRPSNVLLIDGERGSGKTEALLTLLAYLKSPFVPDNKDLVKIRESVNAAVQRNPEAGQAIGIPVQVLDLQPLPRRTSLLMQLATRLYKLVESHPTSADHRYDAPALHEHAEPGQKLRAAWHKLVGAAASAEPDGGRSRHLTPEDLADELEAQERERAGLYECWSKFVDQVIRVDLVELQYRGPAGGTPCLVIPIDDADMNPARCVELLELVRSLWHPRVVFLLTGHTDLFHALLQTKFESDGLSPARSESLARLYFDKVVPKHQRFAVWADSESALKLLSSSAGVWSSVIQSVPELKLALPQRWRAVRDLEAQLQMYGAPGPASAKRLLRSALDEADLAPSIVRHLEKHILPVLTEENEGSDDHAHFILDCSDLMLQPILQPMIVGMTPVLSLQLYKRRQSQVALKTGRVVVDGTSNAAPIPLPREVEAALYLAAISADDLGGGARVSRELTPGSYPFADAHIHADKLDLQFAWPTPEWVKTLDFLLFRRGWEQILDEFRPLLAAAEDDRLNEQREEALSRLVHAFVSALCTLAQAGEKATFDAKRLAAVEPDWDLLAQRLFERVKDRSHPRTRAFADWAVTGATMFFWSEYGLPPTAHDAFARCWLRWLWRSTGSDDEYLALFGRVIEGRKHLLGRTAEPFRGVPANDLTVLIDAVSTTRNPVFGATFRDMDAERATKWWEQLNLGADKRHEIVQEIINHISSNIQWRTSQKLQSILDGISSNYHEHLSFHLWDHLTRIAVQLPDASSVATDANTSLESYVRRHAEVSQWPPDEIMLMVTPATGSIRTLISFLGTCVTRNNTQSSADALREIIRVFAAEVGWTVPDLRSQAMLRYRYELPTIGSDDKSYVIQTGIVVDLTLNLTKIDRDLWWRDPWGQQSLELIRHLSSLHDLIVDQHDIQLERPASTELEQDLYFTDQLAARSSATGIAFGAPEPRWITLSEIKMLVGNYGVIAQQIRLSLESQNAWNAVNVYCLALVICANRALLRHPDWDRIYPITKSQEWGQRKLGEERFAIRTAREYLARLRNHHYRGRRWQAVEAWARYGVPLYAAPESGMTEEEAGEWLSMFADSIEQDRDLLRAVRRYRAKLALQKADRPCDPADVDTLLGDIDANVPATHAWLRLIERRPVTPSASPSTEPVVATGKKRKPTHSARKPKAKQPKTATRKPTTKQR